MPFWCRECGSGFDNLSVVQDHRAKYHQVRFYQCPKCPYISDDKVFLVNAHMSARHRGYRVHEDNIKLAVLAPVRTPTQPELTSDKRRRIEREESRHTQGRTQKQKPIQG